jgi:hypothetical protein
LNHRFSAILAIIFSQAGAVMAADSDPVRSEGRASGNAAAALADGKNTGPRRCRDHELLQATQKYYGKGYTVAYGYVPVDERSRKYRSTKLESDHFKLPAGSGATAGGFRPRLTLFLPEHAAETVTVTFPARNHPRALPCVPARRSAESSFFSRQKGLAKAGWGTAWCAALFSNQLSYGRRRSFQTGAKTITESLSVDIIDE